jgi:hypothetical protein
MGVNRQPRVLLPLLLLILALLPSMVLCADGKVTTGAGALGLSLWLKPGQDNK